VASPHYARAPGMTSPEPAVLVLLRDRKAVARLTEALRPGTPGAPPHAGAAVHEVRTVAELRAALEARPYPLLVVEQRDANGTPTDEIVRVIAERYANTVIIGYAPVRVGMSSDVLAFTRAGVHELVMGGIDDAVLPLRRALAEAPQRWTTDRLLAELATLVPRSMVPLVRFCLERVTEDSSVPAIARALGVTRQTLVARTRAAGLNYKIELATW
jgi:hypothetical protein